MDSTRRPSSPRANLGLQRALFLLLGVALGGGLVLGTLAWARREAPRVADRRPPATVEPNLPRGHENAVQNSVPPKPTADDGAPPKGATPLAAKPNPGNEGPGNAGPGKAPPPKQISGTIPDAPLSSGTSPFNPGPIFVSPDEKASPKTTLVDVRLSVSDGDKALSQAQVVAAKAGGVAIQFDEHASEGPATGALLFVPQNRLADAEKALGGVGSIVIKDHWSGTNADRLDRLQGAAESAVSDLRVRRQELLVKYLEDAPQVTLVDQEIERIQRSLSALRAQKASAGTAILKLKFLS